jgi:hypothetical protein
MQRIQAALRTGALARSKTERALHLTASKCEIPKCAACQFAKAHKRPLQGQRIKQEDSEKEGNLKKNSLLPGQCVACDHFVSSAKGRLFVGFGKTDSSKMYSGACVFTDLATGYIHVEPQISFTAHETLQATERFEAVMKENGVIIHKYMFDNGSAFTSAEYRVKLVDQQQKSQQAAVGAHSQNVAERAVQTISSMARTMMIHAAIHWPSIADTCLWPMAVKQAEYIHNRFPTLETGLSPYKLLTQTKFERLKLMDLHVWGCPTYILDPKIQDGKSLPRWQVRSRRAQYMGSSSVHASTVPNVLNLTTHRITAQYHCVFDDWFATVDMNPDEIPDFESDMWTYLFGNAWYLHAFDPDDGPPPTLHPDFHQDVTEPVHHPQKNRIQKHH